MSPLCFMILASAALVCAAPEGRDTRPRAMGIAVSSSEVAFQVAKRVLDAFDFAVAMERMDKRAAQKLSQLLGTTVTFPHHRTRAGGSGGFNRLAAAMPTFIRDRILREHDVDVRLHAWLAARPLP